jgi:hypothetical protein
VAGQRLRDAEPDTAIAAGDHGDATGEVEKVHGAFPVFGELSWYAARQPVRARSCDMTLGYAFATMDKPVPKIKYAPGKTNSGLRN